MLGIGVQTRNVIEDENPSAGFEMMAAAGFTHADFSLNCYLTNIALYEQQPNHFFDKSTAELEAYFSAHKQAAQKTGITIGQMHMPYPMYVPGGKKELNDYLQNEVTKKSMEICAFLECPYIVVHGFKLARILGSEEAEWERTEQFLHSILPFAREMNITVCLENIYNNYTGRIVEGPCCDIKKVIERIDRMNDNYHAEVLGFCFDTGHANLIGLDNENFITLLGNRLKVLHIHDNDGIGDLHQIPFTFTKSRENISSTDWDGFLKGLRNINYQGVLNFETAPVLQAFPHELKKETLHFIAQIGKYFANELGNHCT